MSDGSGNAPAVTPAPGGAPDGQPQVGAQVGRYRLVRPIGTGASGRVFEVAQIDTGDRAAMKLISREWAERPGALRRILGEARAASELDHPHVARISEVIESGQAGGTTAVVVELVDGQSIQQRVTEGGPLSIERLVPILAQVIDAIAAAHAANLIHRDLTPERILLTSRAGTNDYVVILGFGLARATAGNPAYAAPAGEVDGRVDIYSFGVILYELLCGRLPFEPGGRGPGAAAPPAPKAVLSTPTGRTLDALARRCLRSDPEQRWQSASGIKKVLEALLCEEEVDLSEPANEPVGDRPRGPEDTVVPSGEEDFLDELEQPSRKGRRAAAAALAVLVLGGGGFLYTRTRKAPSTAAVAAMTPERAPLPAAAPAPAAPAATATTVPQATPPRPAAPEPPPLAVQAEPPATVRREDVPPAGTSDVAPTPSKAVHKEKIALPDPAHRKSPRHAVGHEGTVNPFGN